MLLACIADRLGLLVWMKTKDAEKNRNRPKSIVETMTKTKPVSDTIVFKDADAYEAARKKILEKINNGD